MRAHTQGEHQAIRNVHWISDPAPESLWALRKYLEDIKQGGTVAPPACGSSLEALKESWKEGRQQHPLRCPPGCCRNRDAQHVCPAAGSLSVPALSAPNSTSIEVSAGGGRAWGMLQAGWRSCPQRLSPHCRTWKLCESGETPAHVTQRGGG